ncbi:hypothetical protein DFO63_4170 [Stenotrophomonas sp. AG209]|uniref:hypothetical protein n=1 Tax=Stenotrophomonas sp. AG209 TaxID=2183909 RepID=UPI000E5C182D|nr:hypothetical protein [Stenotrophomonas sp. AG209]RIA19052.1 hypothetical protein DFO63_4170 [Stenotrophomonas sp. AG209]
MVETVLGMTDLQIKLFTATGQILVAVAVGIIAWRQWRTAQMQAETARNKLKFDLFTRRMEAYDRIRDATFRAISADWREDAEQQVFSSLKDIRWLFGQSIYNFIWQEIYEPLIDLWDAKVTIAEPGALTNPEVRKSRDAAVLRRRELRETLTKNLSRLEEMMASFLTLNH